MDLTSFTETLEKINELKVKMTEFDLKNMNKLIKELKINTKKFKVVHVTGTNGKGSVTAFISSVLSKAGYNVGAYISPHVLEITERITINGKHIEKHEFVRLSNLVFKVIKKKKIKSSYFEFLTALAFLYFQEKKIDFLVAEVGLGGRLDATNVLNGEVNVITSISLEHTQMLGNTIEKIAIEKGGIIKKNSITVIGKNNAGLETIKKITKKKNSQLVEVNGAKISGNLEFQEFCLLEPFKTRPFKISLLGEHQIENASLALAALLSLLKKGYRIPDNAIAEGLLNAKNIGRLQIISKKPLIVVDCAHNPDGFKVLNESLKMFEYKKLYLVFAVMGDKNWRKMLTTIKFDKLFVTKVDEERGLDPKKILKVYPKAKAFANPKLALQTAKKLAKKEDLILVAGSISLVGEILK